MTNIKMRIYRVATLLLKNKGLEKHPWLLKLHQSIVKNISNAYIDVNGYKMTAGEGDWLHFQYTGEYEPLTTNLLSKIIKNGSTVVDVGANIGYYTILFSRLVGDMGRVYAFEPESVNFSYLTKNIALNDLKNVISVKKAVSDKNETAKLYIHPDNPGGHTLIDCYDDFKSISVDCVSLNEFLRGAKIDFIKIDVEGAEPKVLAGAKEVFDDYTGILFEFNVDLASKNIVWYDSLFASLLDSGYDLLGVDEKRKEVIRIDARVLLDIFSVYKGRSLNVLCSKIIPVYPMRDKARG